MKPAVSQIRYTPASEAKAATGLLGYVSLLLDGTLRVDGIAVRRTREGELRLSFPARRDRRGNVRPYLRPIDDDAREALERAVFETLNQDEMCVPSWEPPPRSSSESRRLK